MNTNAEYLELLTKKFLTPVTPWLSKIAITDPLTLPYDELRHGNSINEFSKHPEFPAFSEKYYALLKQLLNTAVVLQLPSDNLKSLISNVNTFVEHLFNPGYCDVYPALLWNSVREHLEAVVVLLRSEQISADRRLEVLKTLGPDMTECPGGVLTKLQNVIGTLLSHDTSILVAKERLTEQLVIHFIQERQLCHIPEMEVHYVNAFINNLSDKLGLVLRSHERAVKTDHHTIQQNAKTCMDYVTQRLPGALVDYLADKLESEARKLFQAGKFIADNYQDFLSSSLGKFFDQSEVMSALLVEGDAIGEFALPSDKHLLKLEIARHLMRQQWLQPHADTPLVEVHQGTLYALADRWFWWQKQEGSSNQQPRPATEAEVLALFNTVTQTSLNPLLCNTAVNYIINGNDDQARLDLGKRYLEGHGVAKNAVAAAKLFKLVKRDSPAFGDAQEKLGVIYQHGLGVPQDYQKAGQYYQIATKERDNLRMLTAGEMYCKGLGVAINHVTAANLFKAVKKDSQAFGKAQYNLGVLYQNGLGVTQDYLTATKYYQLAADSGYDPARLALGSMYLEGIGVAKDEAAAAQLFRLVETRSQEFTQAQYNLGAMYQKGRGVPRNYPKAAKHYQVAADRGYNPARLALESMNREDSMVSSEAATSKVFGVVEKLNHGIAACSLLGDQSQGLTSPENHCGGNNCDIYPTSSTGSFPRQRSR
jgi:TPR repeat protein